MIQAHESRLETHLTADRRILTAVDPRGFDTIVEGRSTIQYDVPGATNGADDLDGDVERSLHAWRGNIL